VGFEDAGDPTFTSRWRAVARRARAELVGEDAELRLHHGLFLRRVDPSTPVHVAVGADLGRRP
jgi:hypothetical protein